MDNLVRLLTPLSHLSQRSRMMIGTVGGVILGVLLIFSGWALTQLVGALSIVAALALARSGNGAAGRWLMDPRAQIRAVWQRARRATPEWAWQAIVGALLVVAFVAMSVELLTAGKVGLGTLGDFAKGVIALAMMGSLALWNGNGVVRRFGRRLLAGRTRPDAA